MKLDPRQRAMLLEMGVRVWSPTDAPEAAAAPPVDPTAEVPHRAASASAPTSVTTGPAVQARRTASALPAAGAAPATSAPLLPAPERAAAIAQMDWATLEQSVSGCRACGLCETRRHTVFGVGQFQSRVDWLVIGEAPGEREDVQGEPFVGPAGKLLDAMLAALGLSRSSGAADDPQRGDAQTVFITNVLKCRPPGNRNPQPAEIAQCLPYLERQIELLQPRIILALGRFAAQALLAPTMPEALTLPLGKLRGKSYSFGSHAIPVVVSYHPAYLLRSLPDKAKSWADLVLAMQVLRDAPPR